MSASFMNHGTRDLLLTTIYLLLVLVIRIVAVARSFASLAIDFS
jgi:hypothetical protein